MEKKIRKDALPITSLLFDTKNYRYSTLLEGKNQEDIQLFFKENSLGFSKLYSNMQKEIFLDMRFLVEETENNSYIVLDGNTRLAVLKELYNDGNSDIRSPEFQIDVIIYENRSDADSRLEELHTKDMQTSWSRIAQARYRIDKGKATNEDILLLQVEKHLQQIDGEILYHGKNYPIKTCLDNEQGFRPTETLLRCYKDFKKLNIHIPDTLTQVYEVFIKKLLNSYDKKLLNSDTNSKKRRDLIETIWNESNTENIDSDTKHQEDEDQESNNWNEGSFSLFQNRKPSRPKAPNSLPKIENRKQFNDFFKELKDQYGHNISDSCIYKILQELSNINCSKFPRATFGLFRSLIDSLAYHCEHKKNKDYVKPWIQSFRNKYRDVKLVDNFFKEYDQISAIIHGQILDVKDIQLFTTLTTYQSLLKFFLTQIG